MIQTIFGFTKYTMIRPRISVTE